MRNASVQRLDSLAVPPAYGLLAREDLGQLAPASCEMKLLADDPSIGRDLFAFSPPSENDCFDPLRCDLVPKAPSCGRASLRIFKSVALCV